MKRLIPLRFYKVRNWVDHNGALLAFFLVIGLGTWGILTIRDQADQTAEATAQATEAICNIRGFYKREEVQSQKFLDTHPGKLPDFLTKLGITRASIKKDISDNRHRVKALKVVKCPPNIG